ncbi:hypothetical protein NFI95_09165 [Acetobacteraceae bacterium KSS8]|uniref:N-acetyltransferase domain-containing protein n=1 Tax=Endosaccharibacter trunci TaxID=2812733 RepID=A0ABT1W6W3_9PROT|nr:hypothetical protein [Acetobacteraceae bacterium KSS8]
MTPALTIVPVETRGQMQRFLRLPRRIYRGLPGFVPPLDLERRGVMSPRSAPFFKEGRARFFLAMRGRRCVGRISAQVSPLAVLHWGDRIGMFGAIDAVDDAEVVRALVEAAATWLRAENMRAMRGPFLLSMNGEAGLLVEGQLERPMLMSPWHPAYLGALLEAAGLAKVKDLVSYELEVGPAAEAALPVGRMRLADKGTGLSVRELRPDRLAEDAAIMGRLFNDAWHENWGFVPITDHDLEAMVKELKPLIRPEHLVMVERDGDPVGFALVLPNIYDVVGDLGGNPGPLGWGKLAVRLLGHRFRSGRVLLLGISASLRDTTLGAMMPSLIVAELMRRGRTMPLRTVELGWVLEDNHRMRRLIERLSPNPNKVFRIYERALD